MRGLTDRERERYLRQLVIPAWGEETQEKLRGFTVFVAGAGGLGSAAILYLAAAGMGRIRVCDGDRVELSNLNRQVLHAARGLGSRKAVSARKAVRRLNPHVVVEPLVADISRDNAAALLGDAGLILDCLDNVPARLALNEIAVRAGLPLVHAGVRGLGGQLTFIHPPETGCLACFLGSEERPGPGTEPAPILGAVAGALGCLQALEAVKYAAGIGGLAKNRMIFWDGESMRFEEAAIGRNPRCAVCASRGP